MHKTMEHTREAGKREIFIFTANKWFIAFVDVEQNAQVSDCVTIYNEELTMEISKTFLFVCLIHKRNICVLFG